MRASLYTDKPRLFFKEADFVLEQDNAFLVEAAATVDRERDG